MSKRGYVTETPNFFPAELDTANEMTTMEDGD